MGFGVDGLHRTYYPYRYLYLLYTAETDQETLEGRANFKRGDWGLAAGTEAAGQGALEAEGERTEEFH